MRVIGHSSRKRCRSVGPPRGGAKRRLMVFLPAGAALLLSLGWTTHLASRDRQFTGFMAPAGQAQLGRSEHSKIFARYGEPYADPKLADWVTGIGRTLA